MFFTETQLDWGLGTGAIVLLVIILVLAFWPESRRRHRRSRP